MKAAKLIETDDGLYMVKPCDVDEMDLEGATPAESIEDALAMLPSMLDEGSEDESPMMEGEQDLGAMFAQGFEGEQE
jgi:hypothetical protein